MPRRLRQDAESMRIWYTALEKQSGLVLPCKDKGAAIYLKQRLYEARRAEEAADGVAFNFLLNSLKLAIREIKGTWCVVAETTIDGLTNGPITDLSGNAIELVPPKAPIQWEIGKRHTEHYAEKRIHTITPAKTESKSENKPMLDESKFAVIPEMPWNEIIQHSMFTALAIKRLNELSEDGTPFRTVENAIRAAGIAIAQSQKHELPANLPAMPPIPQAVQDAIDKRNKQFPQGS